ncbi:hypothetical protein EYZ11_001922 [Aspergillus tanneri]|uniref:Programmed cell death protein 2 C-terminal domain-containing protein n=1 Tax=Aspergillus tanneri TaxID=1220188 RepID=A0A4S3JSR7_9EURO|nr:uncharacterized protein ATNIH1004_007471 [Aspergillus tanneri]KAA8646048.1 hypothetical protein ATNIH1004_007471 [Aspergillus tanneri]THC98570.1 hypothetical protein EYZ11_001922 [Aspergillus tanneri]
MDHYDSDSSGFEEEGDFTDTGVLLGYAAEDVIEDTISHLGGWPSWLDGATPPPAEFASCKVCNQPMVLLLELHGDLPDHFPDNERRLYLFSCPRKACSKKNGSIRALRASRRLKDQRAPSKKVENQEPPKEEQRPEAPKQDLGASLFGSTSLTGSVSANANPFSSSSATSTLSGNNPFAVPAATPTALISQSTKLASSQPAPANSLSESFADKVRVSSPPPTTKTPEASGPSAPWPSQSAFPEPYKHYYLDAEYETLSRPSTPAVPENVTIDSTEEEAGGGSSVELKDALESQLDKAFIKFSTRLAHNPEQVLRYEFRGSPILYSQTDAVAKFFHDSKGASSGARVTTVGSGRIRIPRCEYCGSERVFELQLVPHAISVLEEDRDGIGMGPKDDAGMEWGTIILGVCSKDCAPDKVGVTGWREEWAGVQWEESK